MFSLIYAYTNGWANNRDASDLRRHRAYYDVTEMKLLDYGYPESILPATPFTACDRHEAMVTCVICLDRKPVWRLLATRQIIELDWM